MSGLIGVLFTGVVTLVAGAIGFQAGIASNIGAAGGAVCLGGGIPASASCSSGSSSDSGCSPSAAGDCRFTTEEPRRVPRPGPRRPRVRRRDER